MAGMSDYLEQALLNELFRNANFAVPTTYIALLTADPTDAGTMTGEVSAAGSAYARLLVNKDGVTSPYWAAPADNGAGGYKVVNTQDLNFAVATANWGTITHIAIMDAVTGGNMLFSGALGASKLIQTNDKLTIPATTLVVNLD